MAIDRQFSLRSFAESDHDLRFAPLHISFGSLSFHAIGNVALSYRVSLQVDNVPVVFTGARSSFLAMASIHRHNSGSSSPSALQDDKEMTHREHQQEVDLHLAASMTRAESPTPYSASRSRSRDKRPSDDFEADGHGEALDSRDRDRHAQQVRLL